MLSSVSFAFGKADIIRIDYQGFRKGIINDDVVKMGEIYCYRDDIRIEVYPSRKGNYKSVKIACKPKIEPLVTYPIDNEDVADFINNVMGKFDCLTGKGIKNCPKLKE